MSKAILVMDMPSNCMECACPIFSPQICICRVSLELLTEEDKHKRPNHCPLRECPQKKEEYGWGLLEHHKNFNKGYNACIDEILGGAEND